VENMDGSQLFASMFKDDPEGEKLLLAPGAEELKTQSQERFDAVVRTMFDFGLKVSRLDCPSSSS
jgi:hypothetical protein